MLRSLQAENRPASEADQRVLARWGGWGALWQVFDEDKPDWDTERARLRNLLSEQEWQAARLTTINAHYTDPALIAPIWGLVSRLGFSGGRVLEPGCGAGTFIGLAPESALMTGVELDLLTAAVAQRLYPAADIRAESFAATRFPAGHFDAAVGNVPFADVVLYDPRYNQARLSLHNHFIVKALELVRPGGVVAVLTSRYTMDAVNPAARRAMVARADLVAAVRLPSGAHRRAAGTEAVTDLLVLRRRPDGESARDLGWETSTEVDVPGPLGPEAVHLNSYWVVHPQHVLGEFEVAVGMHQIASLEVRSDDSARAGEHLEQLLAAVAERALAGGLGFTARPAEVEVHRAGWTPAMTGEVDGQLVGAGGRFFQVDAGQRVELDAPRSQHAELADLLAMRDSARALIAAEAATLDDTQELAAQRTTLAAAWQTYVERYGPINRFSLRRTGRRDEDGEEQLARIVPPPVRLLRRDPFGTLVLALEVFDAEAQTAEPAGILRERQILPREPVHGVDTAADGLAVVLDTKGRVDVDEIARLMGVDSARAVAELGELVFAVPGSNGTYQTRAEYLSGNIRLKLRAAREAEVATAGRWARQIAALEAVLPEDVPAGDITASLGAVWIGDEDHAAFLKDLVGGYPTVRRLVGSTWEVTCDSRWGVQATSEWGTSRMPAGVVMKHLLQQERLAVFDKVDDKQVLNLEETTAAIEKGRLIAERFSDWVWEDAERAARLAAVYNEMFNSTVLRDYTAEGELLTLPGLAKSFTPRPHQRTAVARMINEPSVGLFHEVGAGKTAEMAIGATELKRLGLIRKPAVVVPNHMLEQFATEWLQLYPQARLLAASSDDLVGDERRRFVARVATNDWDAVIMTRTAFQRLSLTPANEQAFLDRQITDARVRLEQIKAASGSSSSLKRMEKTLLAQAEKLKAARDIPADAGIAFEQTGIDYLIVDELHDFKNLATASQIADANIAGSKRAMDLFAKIDYLRTTQGERVVTGATATPIANSLAEMHVMMRYLDPEGLAEKGLSDFDAWAATFATQTQSMELSVAGGSRFKLKSRLATFTNVPELLAMFHRFADVKTAEDLHLPVPLVVARPDTGERLPRLVVVERSPELAAYIAEMGERADRIASGGADPTVDNMLKLSTDGRKAALDLRLVHPDHLGVGPSKVAATADELAWVWDRTKHWRYLDRATGEPSPIPGALQIVFCDLSTPAAGWNVYDALKAELVDRGLPEQAVRFAHDAKNVADKARLFQACRSGRVAVLIGSTTKMGTGVNIQDRVIHLLHLDAPWRPADITQRNGRGVRQLNQNGEVLITNVVTDGSFDTFMWQALERKARFIGQVMSGRGMRREITDIGDDALSFAEIKAIASGNPLLLERADAEQDLQRLSRLERSHRTSQRSLQFRITGETRAVAELDRRIPLLDAAVASTILTRGDDFAVSIGTNRFVDRAEAADRLSQLLRQLTDTTTVQLGGLELHAEAEYSRDWDKNRWIWSSVLDRELRLVAEPARQGPQVSVGLITRLEHLVESLPRHVDHLRVRRDELAHSLDQATRLVDRPFLHAAALAAARHRFDKVTRAIADIELQPPAEPPDPEHGAAVDAVLHPTPRAVTGRPALPAPPDLDPDWERVPALEPGPLLDLPAWSARPSPLTPHTGITW